MVCAVTFTAESKLAEVTSSIVVGALTCVTSAPSMANFTTPLPFAVTNINFPKRSTLKSMAFAGAIETLKGSRLVVKDSLLESSFAYFYSLALLS